MSSPSVVSNPVRILYLCSEADKISRQLQGETLTWHKALPLRDDISTDEITPLTILTHFDSELGRYPYTGLVTQGVRPIGTDAIRNAGFNVVVAGKRYGKGSSREHSPMAEKSAGIQLVIAESFERIYRQNADNIGLYTSTNLGLVERLLRGEAITLGELIADRDTLTATIVRAGGLLKYGSETLAGIQGSASQTDVAAAMQPTTPTTAEVRRTDRAQTLFEKIVARHLLATPDTPTSPMAGDGVFVRPDWRFIHEYYTGMAAYMLHEQYPRPLRLAEAHRIVVFEDHTSYVDESPNHVARGIVPNVRRMCEAQRKFVDDYGLRLHRTLHEKELALDDGSNVAGISHAMITERYALPGQLVVGTDSHTPHSGALGCVAFGIGSTDMANAFITNAVRLALPEPLRVVLNGKLAPGVTAKDVVLHLLALPEIRAGEGVGKVFEFTGTVVGSLSIDERATLTNMTAELGGFTGIVAPDEETVRFLRERRKIDFKLEPWMRSDANAQYAMEIHLDCSDLTPMVATPGDPGNGLPLSEVTSRPRVDIAYGGSCTAGKREDFEHYYAVLEWAHRQGMSLASGVELYLQYGTTAVRDYCIAQGYHELFQAMGARILQPSCGACANCGPGSSTSPDQITVSAINRNFPGRSGPGNVWLASPPTVAASAVAGRLVSFAELQQLTPALLRD